MLEGKSLEQLKRVQVPMKLLESRRSPAAHRDAIAYKNERHFGASKPQTGRPKLYSDRDERCILEHVRLNLKCTYANIREACDVTCVLQTSMSNLSEA